MKSFVSEISVAQETAGVETLSAPPCLISHKWPSTDFRVEIFSGITFVKRVEPMIGQRGGGRRGVVSNFSRASRKGLLQKMARSRGMDSGYFGTFTYPGEFRYTWQECKNHLFIFRKRILRRFPQARIIWRMEVKPRLSGESIGLPVPHYHFLIFGLPYGWEERLETWFGDNWNIIANYQNEDVPYLRSEVKQIRSRSQAVYYASKYQAKIDDGLDEGFGRHWGFFGEWDETMSGALILTGAETCQLKRLALRWMKGKAFERSQYQRAKGEIEKADTIRDKAKSLTRRMAKINAEFGIALFGLGDHDDMTWGKCTMIDLISNAQRQVQY